MSKEFLEFEIWVIDKFVFLVSVSLCVVLVIIRKS